jgi:hypothetical protein
LQAGEISIRDTPLVIYGARFDEVVVLIEAADASVQIQEL